jgi:hypothetical protein
MSAYIAEDDATLLEHLGFIVVIDREPGEKNLVLIRCICTL